MEDIYGHGRISSNCPTDHRRAITVAGTMQSGPGSVRLIVRPASAKVFTGQQQAVTAKDETGAPAQGLAVTFVVTGAKPILAGTSDLCGRELVHPVSVFPNHRVERSWGERVAEQSECFPRHAFSGEPGRNGVVRLRDAAAF